jgi:hypothetical protein
MSRETRPLRPEFASESELGKSRGGAGFDIDIDVDDTDSIRLGCSMLSQVRLQGRQRGALAPMRCALGFALRTREDIGKCMGVEGPNSCWKSAPSWRVAAAEPEPLRPPSDSELSGAADAQLSAFLAGPPTNGAGDLEIEVDVEVDMLVEFEQSGPECSELVGQPAPNGSIE